MNLQAISDLVVGSPGRVPTPLLRPLNGGAAAAGAPAEEPSRHEVSNAVEGMNAFLGSANSHIQFAMHEGSHRMMVEVIDNQTQQVVKTIPSKELLDLAAKIGELVGTLLDKKG